MNLDVEPSIDGAPLDSSAIDRGEHDAVPARALGRSMSPTLRWSIDIGAVAVVATAIMAALVRPWSRPMRVPFVYWGDALSLMSEVRNFDDGPWYFTTHRLGAPFGVNLLDFPMGGDNLYWLILRVGHVLTSDPAVLVNALYLLTFPVCAVVAFVCFRLIDASRSVSALLAILFAFAPSHFLRNTSHLVLAGAVSVPVGCAIAVRLMRGDSPFIASTGPFRPRFGKVEALWVLGAVLLATAGSYYAIFALLLLVAGAFGGAVSRRSLRPAVSGLVITAGLIALLAVNNLPTLLYQSNHGANPEVARRHVWELDIIPLRPILLTTPIPGHRFAPFNELNRLVLRSFSQNSEPVQYLGSIGTIGLAVAVGSLLVSRTRRGSSASSQMGALITVLVFLGVWGGLSIFVYWLAFPQLRGYNRLSVYIHFLALAALIPALELVRRRLGAKYGRFATVAAFGAIAVVGLWDQIGVGMIPDARPNVAAWNSDATAVRALEAAVPPGSKVFQFPVVPFPENGPFQRMTDYDHLRPSLHSHHLEWSYGGMRGREADWQTVLLRLDPAEQLDAVTAAGFRVLWIDRFGYPDPSFEAAVTEQLGHPPTTSADGRYAWFDLAQWRSRLERRFGASRLSAFADGLLEQGQMVFYGDAGNAYGSGTDSTRTVPASVSVEARATRPMDAVLVVDARADAPSEIRFQIGDRIVSAPVGTDWTEVEVPVRLGAGATKGHVDVVGDDGQLRGATLRNLVIVERCGPVAELLQAGGQECLSERPAA